MAEIDAKLYNKRGETFQIVTMQNKRMAALALAAVTLSACFTEADYHPYSGAQGKNPTATGSFIDTKYAVPTYYGYPPRSYRVLGEMDTETHGRFRDALAAAANRASQYGADAMLVLGHEHQTCYSRIIHLSVDLDTLGEPAAYSDSATLGI